jgi:hypothetical protein
MLQFAQISKAIVLVPKLRTTTRFPSSAPATSMNQLALHGQTQEYGSKMGGFAAAISAAPPSSVPQSGPTLFITETRA